MTAVPAASSFLRGPAPETTRSGTEAGDVFDLAGARIAYGRNEEIYGEGEPADLVYKVAAGAVRTCKLLQDGRRQVGAFHLPGDVFGLEAGGQHRFAAEAIVDSKVVVVRRTTLLSLAARDSDLFQLLFDMTVRDLGKAQEHLLLLGRKTALEKVATFLLTMASRMPGGNVVELPMSRMDIADHLGLTIETVSRTLTILETRRAIELPTTRRILLRNAEALGALNG